MSVRQWSEIQEVSWPLGASRICLIEASSGLRFFERPLVSAFDLKVAFRHCEGMNGCLGQTNVIRAAYLKDCSGSIAPVRRFEKQPHNLDSWEFGSYVRSGRWRDRAATRFDQQAAPNQTWVQNGTRKAIPKRFALSSLKSLARSGLASVGSISSRHPFAPAGGGATPEP